MKEIKSVIVFGATGPTGLQIVKAAIARGLQVSTFVRSPEKIPDDIKSKIHRIIKGDIFDAKQVEDAIEGHDAVLSSIGPKFGLFNLSMVMTTGCTNIVSGMKKHNVRKLIALSGAAQLPNAGWIAWLFSFRGMLADHKRQIVILEKEKEFIDWIAILPPVIKISEDVNPAYKVKVDDMPGIFQVTCGEIADFAMILLEDDKKRDQYLHCKVGISSQPKVQKDTLPGDNSVTTAELADFMVNVVKDNSKMEEFKCCNVGISSHPKTS